MKHLFSLVFITLATFSLAQNKENAFNSNWLFFKDQSDSLTLNELVESKFRSVNLPHDWSIEDLPNPSETVVGPFTKKSIGKKSTGFTVGGTAWYLKKFATEKKCRIKLPRFILMAFIKMQMSGLMGSIWAIILMDILLSSMTFQNF